MATVDAATVTLTVNGREVTVAKGLSVVEAASEAGIEIPVFCYEPRLGAGVGACRMCLCEIEGMPKLQTACTTPAADGMVVNTQSARASEGQDAVLEFLLLNHPLDCPVCDKGGECPLQDLTFRYGPGVTRMTLPKRTHDKPVPISPLIKLDRERCILCYRCTRFSEVVSGDMQLVTEHRGAHSMITTFEGRPYTGEFSGNVTELCPVGALTSTTYRFRARPWEIQNIPTVCTGCADRLQHLGHRSARARWRGCCRATTREVDEGWLCDRGRYALAHLRADDRISSALIRGGRGLEAVAASDALDHVSDRCAATVERVRPRLGRGAGLRRRRPTRKPTCGRASWTRAGRRHQRVPAPRATPAWTRWRPTRPRSPTWSTAGADRGGRRHRPESARAGAGAADPQGCQPARRPGGHGGGRRHTAGDAARRAATSRPPPGTAHATLLAATTRRRRAGCCDGRCAHRS